MILALLAALFGAAQEAIVVYEGVTTTHNVSNNPGNTYSWEMYKDFSPDILADPLECEFISPLNTNTVEVQWKLPGVYYLKITETDPESCSNVKILPVTVLTLGRTIGFKSIVSNSCTSLNSNGFSLNLNVSDENGLALGSEYFPLTVNFMFNGASYLQELSFNNSVLEIKNEWVIIDPGIENTFEVQITGATDVADGQILPQSGMDLHRRTIYTIPEIEFATNSITVNKGDSFEHIIQLISGEYVGAEYSWSVLPVGGTSTDVSLFTSETATILWDGNTGTYELQVDVKDGNGCISETIRQNINIVESGDILFNSAYQSTITCSDLAGGLEGMVPEHNKSEFQVSYGGEANLSSAKITIKNPDGKYIGSDGVELPDQQEPEVEIINPDIGKDITFAIADNWENTTNTNITFEIKLISGITSDQQEIKAVDGTGTARTIMVIAKPVIEFK